MPTAPLTQQDAASILHEQIYAPVFFEKLASYNVAPRNQDEAERLLSIGTQLLGRYEAQEAQKQASEGNFLALLDDELRQAGGAPAAQVSADSAQVKQASDQIALNPQLAHATLSLLASLGELPAQAG